MADSRKKKIMHSFSNFFPCSIMAVSRLARFHAVSFAMRRELGLDPKREYPFLAEDPVYRKETGEMFARTQASVATRLHSIFQHGPQDARLVWI